jgi:EmrB/QacA subfamily drug resistance transporter
MTGEMGNRALPGNGRRLEDGRDTASEGAAAVATSDADGTGPATENLHLGLWTQISVQCGPFLSMLDGSIVNVAVTDISKEFHTSLSTVGWTISAYLLALGAGLPASAWLARGFGTRRVYLIGLIGFGLASLGCALAPTIGALIVFRALQGLTGAPLVPLALSLIFTGNTRYQMPIALSLMLFLAPALGPGLGGILILAWGWRPIFMVNIPVIAIALVGAFRIPDIQRRAGFRGRRFDVTGLVLLAAGMTLITYGTFEISRVGLETSVGLSTCLVGIALLVVYIRKERGTHDPILTLRILTGAAQRLGLGCYTIASVVLWAILFLVPVFVQQTQGRSAITAGLVLMPQGIVMGLAAPLGEVMVRTGRLRLTVSVGMLVLAGSTAALLTVGVHTAAWLLAVIVGGRGIALALTVQPLIAGLLGNQAGAEMADASTVFTVSQRIGGSIGVGMIAGFYQERVATGHAFTDCAWLLVILALLGAALAVNLPRRSPVPQFRTEKPGT